MDEAQRLRLIGEAAAAEVQDGATIGLGTGSTANAMIRALGARVREGLTVTGVTTSDATAELAGEMRIPIVPLDEVESIDLGIDGADEIDSQLNLLKGKGGALLYEKLVAERSRRFIVIATSEKLVDQLGTRLPLPVEVVPYGHTHTMRAIAALGISPVLRVGEDATPFVSDGGHYIVDCTTGPIGDAAALANHLKAMTGIVDHGLFIGMATMALTIDADGEVTRHEQRPG